MIAFIISSVCWIIFTLLAFYAGTERWFKKHRPHHPLGTFYFIMMWVSGLSVIICLTLMAK